MNLIIEDTRTKVIVETSLKNYKRAFRVLDNTDTNQQLITQLNRLVEKQRISYQHLILRLQK